jgi:phage gp46-like protein
MTAILLTPTGQFSGEQLVRVANGTLDRDHLREIITTSLFTWRRARDGDDVTDGASRMGWLMDANFGSRLYLLARAKVTAQTLVDARQYAEEALAWLVTDGIASAVTVTTERAASPGPGMSGVAIEIAVTRPREPESRVRYDLAWS